ncbi:MAG: hypothetical protein AAF661_02715 [Pseudomonadota bacterium]
MQDKDRETYRRIVQGMAFLKNGGEVVEGRPNLPVEVLARRSGHVLTHWKGRRIEEMSRQDLVNCVDDLAEMLRKQGRGGGLFRRR